MAKRKKDLSPHYKANNEGGHGNPPVKHQFDGSKRGPGRPKGFTTWKTTIKKVLGEKVSMSVDGERVEVTVADAVVRCYFKQALTGSKTTLLSALALVEKFAPTEQELENDNFDCDDFNMDELHILGALLGRATAKIKPSPKWQRLPIGTYRIYRRDDGFAGVKGVGPAEYDNPPDDKPDAREDEAVDDEEIDDEDIDDEDINDGYE